MGWYRLAKTLDKTLFVPLIQADTAGSIRLSAMTPGLLEGEPRHYSAFVKLADAEKQFPYHPIVEIKVPSNWLALNAQRHDKTSIRGAGDGMHGLDTDTREYEYHIAADIPSHFIVGLREPVASQISRHSQPQEDLFGEANMELLHLCGEAIRIAKSIDNVSERLVYDIINSPESNQKNVEDFYAKFPGLSNWRRAGGAGDSHLIFGTAEKSVRQEKLTYIQESLEQLQVITQWLSGSRLASYLFPIHEQIREANQLSKELTIQEVCSRESAQKIGTIGDMIGGTRRSAEDRGVIIGLEDLKDSLTGRCGLETAEAYSAQQVVLGKLQAWREDNGYLPKSVSPDLNLHGSEKITQDQLDHMSQKHVSVRRLPT